MNKELEAALKRMKTYSLFAGDEFKKDFELIESAIETLQIIESFKLRTIIENGRYLLIIGNKSYEITEEQYKIVNSYLKESLC